MKNNLFFAFALIILASAITFTSAETFGYGRTEQLPINYSKIPTVNNSDYLDGHDSSYFYQASNPSGFISEETDTLQSVTDRGYVTTNPISIEAESYLPGTDANFRVSSNTETSTMLFEGDNYAKIEWAAMNGAENEKYWQIYSQSNGEMNWGIINDALDTQNIFMRFKRSGFDYADILFQPYSTGKVAIGTEYADHSEGSALFQVYGDQYISGQTEASSFVKSGGLSSEFLKADGSVDSNIYLTEAASYQFDGNNFNGSGNFATTGTLKGAKVNVSDSYPNFNFIFTRASGSVADNFVKIYGTNGTGNNVSAGAIGVAFNVDKINSDPNAYLYFGAANDTAYNKNVMKVTANSTGVNIDSSRLPTSSFQVGPKAGIISTSLTKNNSYLHLGSNEYLTNGLRCISAGWDDGLRQYFPVAQCYQSTSVSGSEQGDWVWYTRAATTDTTPTERMRLNSSGDLHLNNSFYVDKNEVITGNSTAKLYNSGNSTSFNDYSAGYKIGDGGYQLFQQTSGASWIKCSAFGCRLDGFLSIGNVPSSLANFYSFKSVSSGSAYSSWFDLQTSGAGAKTTMRAFQNTFTSGGSSAGTVSEGTAGNNIATFSGNETITNLIGTRTGTYEQTSLLNVFSRVTNAYPLHVIAPVLNNSNITNYHGIHIDSPNKLVGGSGNFTNFVQLYIDDPKDNATTSNYAIYIKNGTSYLGDNVTAREFYDLTPAYHGTPEEAFNELVRTNRTRNGEEYEIDHSTLPSFTQKKAKMLIEKNCSIINFTEPTATNCRPMISESGKTMVDSRGEIMQECDIVDLPAQQRVCDYETVEIDARGIGETASMIVEAMKYVDQKNKEKDNQINQLSEKLNRMKAETCNEHSHRYAVCSEEW